ncbi:glycosyltransferase [Sphingobacterium sp. lm-10]|uniref:glycosyltransferase family 2 protein n=1 Tax=Sphingobacterium sp. lm-10 TaxID=2944904 RepID=UPI002020BD92|nr:glycosyltransferase family 2 protein [Sphingobacterium sp. lm-10]MCL7988619.1 glycosyltransferase [Sphingobacterium sp. lm-10]
MKKLSIVIPCYNCADRISSLLELLMEQYDPRMEVILINDGSTDDTENVIKNIISQIPNMDFRLYSYANSGAARARTIGLERAKGEYIAFIDSDDSVSKNYVSRLLMCMDDGHEVIYYSSVQKLQNSNVYRDKIRFETAKTFTDTDVFLRSQLEHDQWSAAVWTFVFKKALAVSSKARFTERIAHEDHIFSLAIVSHANTIHTMKDTLYIQHITEGSLTNSAKTIAYIEDRHDAYIEAIALVRERFSAKTSKLYTRWSLKQCVDLWQDLFRLRALFFNRSFLKMGKRSPALFISVITSIFQK